MAGSQPQAEALAEPVRVNGSAAEATLSGGELAWHPRGGGGEGRRLELESEVLGCRMEGRKLKFATFAGAGADGERSSALACGGGKGGGEAGDGRTRRRRGEVVLEMESEDAAARWGDAVRDRLASLAPGYEEFGDPVEPTTSCKSNRATTGVHEDEANGSKGETCGYPGPSIKEADLVWRSVNGPFVSVWLGNVPFASEDAMAAPKAEFSDGYLDAAIIRDCPRWDVLGLMFQMKDGAYIESPYVEYFKVKAIRIEPGLRVGGNKGGIIDSDGEVLARGDGSRAGDQPEHLMTYGPPIQLTVDQGLATIFSPR